jgi:hypothetical protein
VRGKRLDYCALQHAGGFAVLAGFAGGFSGQLIGFTHVLAARGISHCVPLVITALHWARLRRHTESHTAEGRQHEANNQQQNQADSAHGKLLLRWNGGTIADSFARRRIAAANNGPALIWVRKLSLERLPMTVMRNTSTLGELTPVCLAG